MNERGFDDNTVWMILLLIVLVPVGLATGWVSRVWEQAGVWLVKQKLLVADQVVVAVPGLRGAGLDSSRLLVIGGAVLVLIAFAVADHRRRVRNPR